MDAHQSLRKFLKNNNVHDYEYQNQGIENRVIKKGFLLHGTEWVETSISFYRPTTKSGDPRIWISGLNKYSEAFNLIVLVEYQNSLYIFNASNKILQQQFLSANSYLSKFLKIVRKKNKYC